MRTKVQDKRDDKDRTNALRLLEELEDYAICLIDRQGLIETWNKGGELMHGYQAAEIIGKSHRVFFSREDLEAGLPERLLQQASLRGKENHEGWRVRRDGTRFWCATHLAARHDAAGIVAGFIIILHDLTAQKTSEEQAVMVTERLRESNEELQRSEEKYHRMISEIPDYAIILLEEDGTIVDWNKGAEKIKQYKASEVVGRNFRLFYSKEDRDAKVPESYLEIARREGSMHREGWRVRKDGTRFWAAVSIIALHDHDGQVIGFSKVTRDLTDRKQAEDRLNSAAEALRQTNLALTQSEERFHKMIAEVKDYAIILLDTEGKILNWNAGAEQIKGYLGAEVIGKSLKIFYAIEDVERGLPDALLEEARINGRAAHEGWRIRKDGTRFWGNVIITALHNEAGEHIGFSKVTRDLTLKKQADDEIRENAMDLSRNNRLLQRLNEDLASFNYVASHDLKEPLRKIQTFASLIERSEDLPEKILTYLKKIKESASRSNSLIDDLLSFSRVSNDRSRFQMVNLNDMVARAKDEFELQIRETNARILSDNLPTISGVQFQLEQLFINLVSNALKFSREKPLIEILYVLGEYQSPDDVEGDKRKYHHVSIVDNGLGFDQQYATKIFDPFQRLDPTMKTAGSGIGLAIVKKVIENHGGWVEAEGRPQVGATFHLYFPAVADLGEAPVRRSRFASQTNGVKDHSQ
jgi:PAS domain S-box-containing protein